MVISRAVLAVFHPDFFKKIQVRAKVSAESVVIKGI